MTVSLAGSLGVHALLYFGLAGRGLARPDATPVALERSQITLSFAEEDTPEAPPQTLDAVSVAAPSDETPLGEAFGPPPPEPQSAIPQASDFQPSPVPAPVPAPNQARLDEPPRAEQTIRPVYPKISRQRGEQGEVLLELDVSSFGAVTDVRVIESSGHSALDAAAEKALRDARFTPAMRDGRPVPATVRLPLAFRLTP